MSDECVFCRILKGVVRADTLYSDDSVTAFRDNRPQAPVHVLIVTNEHIESLDELDDTGLAGSLLMACRLVARREGLSEGYRVVINVGRHAGRVGHLHAHVLGGRVMGWPPG